MIGMGVPRGRVSPLNGMASSAADLAIDPRGDRFWQVNVGGDNCVFEIDPHAGATTDARICPAFGNSQRGLAYDPLSQTFYSGTWNDAILSHFDRAGTLLDSVNTGINIAGLAYQPLSGHLFVLSNASQGYDVYVLDARNSYALLGGFDIPGLADYGQAGLEMTEDGHLWVVDSVNRRVMEVTSGESRLFQVGRCTLVERIHHGSERGGRRQPGGDRQRGCYRPGAWILSGVPVGHHGYPI